MMRSLLKRLQKLEALALPAETDTVELIYVSADGTETSAGIWDLTPRDRFERIFSRSAAQEGDSEDE